MKIIIALFACISAIFALEIPHITGTTPPAVDCPNSLCKGKADGNYQYNKHGQIKYNYFVQCVDGLAYCQACWPLHLVFREECNQCLYNYNDKCVTTKPWYPATTFHCPDKCPNRGPHFNGNIEDPHNPHQYVACWHGQTVGCIACPKGLTFNEKWNACLYDGINVTEPNTDTTTTTTRRPYNPYNNNQHNQGYRY